MRKLLILMLVLGMASMASAGLTIVAYEMDGVTPYDGRDLVASENLTIKLEGQGGDTGDSMFALYVDSLLANLTGGVCTIPAAPDASAHLGTMAYNYVSGVTTEVGIVGAVSAFVALPPYADGVYFDEILFHCAGVGDVTISMDDISTTWTIGTNPMDSLVIHQVPEPMTMALLGLGGLLLRRRK